MYFFQQYSFIFLIFIIATVIAIIYLGNINKKISSIETLRISAVEYPNSEYQGNYIYSASINLAWNEVIAYLNGQKVELNSDNPQIIKLVQLLNSSPFSKKDLDNASYYVKSGAGPTTINAINNELKNKFPQKSFDDLQISLNENDLLIYAYLLKQKFFLKILKLKDLKPPIMNNEKILIF